MKPLSTNSISAWGYVGLFLLFCLPYVGTPALIICALFVPNQEVKNFSRAILLLTLLGIVAIFVLIMLGLFNLDGFDFDIQGGFESLNGIRYYIGL